MVFPESSLQQDYQSRMVRIFEYIDDHLQDELKLEVLCQLAYFSPYHFHRVFKMVCGETLAQYVNRRRLERAASELIHADTRLKEIGFKYGFNDSSSFTRAFKKFYGVGPMEFRKQHPNKFSKIRQLQSKNGQAYPDYEKYICTINHLKDWIKMNAKIEIREVGKIEFAYVQVIGVQQVAQGFDKLLKWAVPMGLMEEKRKMITVYHDSFKVTSPDKVRMSTGVVLADAVEVSDGISISSVGPGRFIVGSYEIGHEEFEKAWTGLFIWMNEKGYRKTDTNPLEIYHNNFEEHPQRKAIVDFYISVR